MLVFFFQLLKRSLYFEVAFTHDSKEPSNREKIHITRLLQENLALPAANQSVSAIICSHIVRIINP